MLTKPVFIQGVNLSHAIHISAHFPISRDPSSSLLGVQQRQTLLSHEDPQDNEDEEDASNASGGDDGASSKASSKLEYSEYSPNPDYEDDEEDNDDRPL